MGRKGPRAKTKIVLKSVKQWEQLGNMHNLKFQTFLNKNHPTNVGGSFCLQIQDEKTTQATSARSAAHNPNVDA